MRFKKVKSIPTERRGRIQEQLSENLQELTVLVTFYNKGQFLKELIKNLEEILSLGAAVIFLDDGSDLQNQEMINEHLRKLTKTWSNTFKFISQENQGSAASRNLLIQETQTAFFMFLDADDLIIVQNLEPCMVLLKQSNADILIGDWVGIDGKSSHVKSDLLGNSNRLIELNGNAKVMKAMGYWRIIYRAEFIRRKEIRFVPTKHDLRGKYFVFDDVFWMIHISCSTGKSIIMEDGFPIYRYFTTEFTPESREVYRKQELLMPIATIYYLRYRKRNGKMHQSEKVLLLENLICNFLDLTPASMKKSLFVFAAAMIRAGGINNVARSCSSICRIFGGMLRKWYRSKYPVLT